MANVFLIGLEREAAEQITTIVSVERHSVRKKSYDVEVRSLVDAGIVFAGGDSRRCLSLLRRVRLEFPTLPFVVVTPIADTTVWLDALEAGATDYCCLPIASRHIQWLMESILQTSTFAGI